MKREGKKIGEKRERKGEKREKRGKKGGKREKRGKEEKREGKVKREREREGRKKVMGQWQSHTFHVKNNHRESTTQMRAQITKFAFGFSSPPLPSADEFPPPLPPPFIHSISSIRAYTFGTNNQWMNNPINFSDGCFASADERSVRPKANSIDNGQQMLQKIVNIKRRKRKEWPPFDFSASL